MIHCRDEVNPAGATLTGRGCEGHVEQITTGPLTSPLIIAAIRFRLF